MGRKPSTVPEKVVRGNMGMGVRRNWHHTWDERPNYFWAEALRSKDWPRDRPANSAAATPSLTFLGRAVLRVGAALFPDWRDDDPSLPRARGRVAPSSGELEDDLRFNRESKDEAARRSAWLRVDRVRQMLVDWIEGGQLAVWHLAKDGSSPPRRAPAQWWHADRYDHLFYDCQIVARAPHAPTYSSLDKRTWLFVDADQLQCVLEPNGTAKAIVPGAGPVDAIAPREKQDTEALIRQAVVDRKGAEAARALVNPPGATRTISRDRVREIYRRLWIEIHGEDPTPGRIPRTAD